MILGIVCYSLTSTNFVFILIKLLSLIIIQTTSCQDQQQQNSLLNLSKIEADIIIATTRTNNYLGEEQQFSNKFNYTENVSDNDSYNITQLLLNRFHHLFQIDNNLSNNNIKRELPVSIVDNNNNNNSNSNKFSDESNESNNLTVTSIYNINVNNNNNNNENVDSQQATLENRKIDGQNGAQNRRRTTESEQQQQSNEEFSAAHKRNYFKILNRVFSRIELPEVYPRSNVFKNNQLIAQQFQRSGHCGLHIGCIEEIPNFPSLLKKPNVSSSFTIYTKDNNKSGFRILYEPLVHHQLQDINTTESELQDKLRSSSSSAAAALLQVLTDQQQQSQPLFSLQAAGAAAAAALQQAAGGTGSHHHHHHHYHHHHNYNNNNPNKQRKRQTAASWRTATKIIHTQEYPFDLASLEQSGFNSSLTTRIIVGGYFAKEDEEWIDEVVKQWLILEPNSNVIKVSWADSNRGLYHSAAYNSRIVGRQLTLFLYYLDQLFHINLNKFHIVGHSLGAHIAGSVGSDNDGKIARITGLDPAGPIFVELNPSMRLDPSDAKFVDVVHTNGGTITKGALGLSIPSGHVDYYSNGGSLQPGCYFSSVTKSIMDPVERVACSHRRSYRYFIEIIKMTINSAENQMMLMSSTSTTMPMPITKLENNNNNSYSTNYSGEWPNSGVSSNNHKDSIPSSNVNANYSSVLLNNTNHNSHEDNNNQIDRRSSDGLWKKKFLNLPRAFLFEAKHDDLVRLTQPEIVLLSQSVTNNRRELSDLAPLKHYLEFHLLNPEFPSGKRGMYFFKTRTEPPFFASKQYALTIKTDTIVRRKMALMAKLDQSLIAEIELDEIPGIYTFAFTPNDSRLINLIETEGGLRIPQLHLMWKHRSFNLLLNQQNELHLTSIELSLLDTDDEDQQPTVKYAVTGATTTLTSTITTGQMSSSLPSLSQSGGVLKSGAGTNYDFILLRNQWHKFEGKLSK